MNKYTTMRPARLLNNSDPMTMEEALAWSMAHINNGWLLCECPERIIWSPFANAADPDSMANCTSLTAFGPQAELR